MAIWRMAMRCGSSGPSMFEKCRELGVAAITYWPIEFTDLSKYSKDNLPEEWKGLNSNEKGNLNQLVFEMRKGDIIYVKHGPQIVGRGVVRGGYQFIGKKIKDPYGNWWSHTVPVKWDKNFKPIEILLGAEQHTILKLDGERLKNLQKALGKRAVRDKADKIRKDADKGTDKSTAKGRGRGQGYGLNADENRAVEDHAMKRAERYFTGKGYEVKDEHKKESYDFLCTKADRKWFVEVKGTTQGPDTVRVTRGEVDHARQHPDRAILFVVYNIDLDKRTKKTRRGKTLVIKPWRPEDKDLKATEYDYTLPEKQKS